jgi:uncharacterized protein (UPF0332 family)
MKKWDFLVRLKLEEKLRINEPSEEISRSYLAKSGNCIKSAKILLNEGLYENSIGEAYYAMYESSLALLFRCGIKCENHTATAFILGLLFGKTNLEKNLLEAKQERIDKQYYVTDEESYKKLQRDAKIMISKAENFTIEIKLLIGSLNSIKISEIRKKLEP